jgi:hypothetical protein
MGNFATSLYYCIYERGETQEHSSNKRVSRCLDVKVKPKENSYDVSSYDVISFGIRTLRPFN